MPKISIIGGGFAGLSAACYLAKNGQDVTVYEKNDTIGGRARHYTENGFMFDMGPSWYWMPDVFDEFFGHFGKKTSDYYLLQQLDPGFQLIFGQDDILSVPAELKDIYATFESIEPGSAEKLKAFMKQAQLKYEIGMGVMVKKPSFSWLEFLQLEVITGAPKLQLLQSVKTHVRHYFKDPRLVALMEFPVLFLGAMANKIPALYTLMNYSALHQGTWYPHDGMKEIIAAMESLAKSLNVKIVTNAPVAKINVDKKKVQSLTFKDGTTIATQGVIATGDYHSMEQQLLDPEYTNYKASYWDNRVMAPSALIFYLAVNKKIKKLIHHNLFFDEDMDEHSRDIYQQPQWPKKPLFYVCCPSKTDDTVAPKGMENLFILMPIAPDLEDTEMLINTYFDIIMQRMEYLCKDSIKQHIVYHRSYCIKDFKEDYNAFKGNAYGLANTLTQTAVLKPTLRNKKVDNLFYAGQLTVPGPGVPPSLISGQLAAEQLLKTLK